MLIKRFLKIRREGLYVLIITLIIIKLTVIKKVTFRTLKICANMQYANLQLTGKPGYDIGEEVILQLSRVYV